MLWVEWLGVHGLEIHILLKLVWITIRKIANVDHITLPYLTDDAIISKVVDKVFNK